MYAVLWLYFRQETDIAVISKRFEYMILEQRDGVTRNYSAFLDFDLAMLDWGLLGAVLGDWRG